MNWRQILGPVALAFVAGLGVAQIMAPASAAAPVLRPNYQGMGTGVNEHVAVLWLLGSDGTLKACLHAATAASTEAPVCSAATTP